MTKSFAFSPIAPDSPVPFYFQVEQAMCTEIKEGRWKPGDTLPSEAELCTSFEVSRTVIRQALDNLVQRGFIVKRKGKPTIVAHPKLPEQSLDRKSGFFYEMSHIHGFEVKTSVVRCVVQSPSPLVAEQLAIEPDVPIIQIIRLRYINNEPVVLSTSNLPYALCKGIEEIDLTDRSLYQTLQDEFLLKIGRGETSIEAIVADAQQAKLLQIKKGAPLFLLQNVTYLIDGTPIDSSEAAHRGDRCKFRLSPSEPSSLYLQAHPEEGPVVTDDPLKKVGYKVANSDGR